MHPSPKNDALAGRAADPGVDQKGKSVRNVRTRDRLATTLCASPFRFNSLSMPQIIMFLLRTFFVFYLALHRSVLAADDVVPARGPLKSKGYWKGDLLPVTCLNRTIETGEHITDAHGNLQYIPFPVCNETGLPLAFPYATPQVQTCTIDMLPDELYHLIEFFVHSDVPLTCRVPTYPLSLGASGSLEGTASDTDTDFWTSFTIALQGTLQLSHLHLHTNINTIFHYITEPVPAKAMNDAFITASHLIASTAYSVPNTTFGAPREGTKVVRAEPLAFTFNVGWVEGPVLPGMLGKPIKNIKDHNVGFSLLSFFALAASAGLGAIGMLVYERRKSGRSLNGLLGGNVGSGALGRSTGSSYGGYGGYGVNTGKRD